MQKNCLHKAIPPGVADFSTKELSAGYISIFTQTNRPNISILNSAERKKEKT
jgi:hypothetical protein